MFGVVELQDNVAVAGAGGIVRLAGVIAVQVRPAGKGLSDSETVPANPFTPVTVMVAVAPGAIASAITSQ